MRAWTGRLHAEASAGFPAHVNAFRPEFAVHGKFGRCQTGGTILAETTGRIGQTRGVAVTTTLIEERRVVAMDDALRGAVASAFAALGAPAFDLPSGAGHDAMCVAAIAPAAMIFVPSAGGLSHVAAEFTSPDDCELGVRALAQSIVAIDRLISKET